MTANRPAARLRPVPPAPQETHPDHADEPRAPAPATASPRPPARPARTRRRLLVGLVLVVIAGLGFAGWRYFIPHAVPMTPVGQGDLSISVKAPGTIDALGQAAIAARVSGQIESLGVAVGQTIAAGTVIATLDAADLESQERAAAAAYDAAKLAARQADAEASRSDASLENAQQTFDRQSDLFAAGTVSRSVFDTAKSALAEAQAAAKSARAAADRSDALATEAEASLTGAKTQLAKATIRAPFAGLIVSNPVNPGDFVAAGQTIATLVDPKTVILAARLDESAIDRIAMGAKAQVTFGEADGPAIAGTVVRIGRSVDSETREFTVDIKPDHLPANWAMGQRGTANISTGVRRDTLFVPTDLIARRKGRPGVWIDQNGRAAWRFVTLGPIGGDDVVVEKGLKPGTEIIPPQNVFPGMKLEALDRDPS